MSQIAWHYTVGPKLKRILEDGALKPVTRHLEPGERAPGERPILWLSRNQDWEPTAAARTYVDPVSARNIPRTLVRFGGIWVELLTRWPKLAEEAGMPDVAARRLEAAGRELGADPAHWCGRLRRIPLEELRCQIRSKTRLKSRSWNDIDPTDALNIHTYSSEALQKYAVELAAKAKTDDRQ